MIDGMDNNLQINGYIGVMLMVDSIQEFKVQTNSYTAEFGHDGGAQVNLVTKSGTNALHGSAYEFLRNTKLDSNNFFNNLAGIKRPPYIQNQYGVTLGGPIRKDKTFFFFGFEGLDIRIGVTRTSTVPTAAMTQGNFGGLATIYDPFNVVGGARQPFPNNVIPTARINSASAALQQFVPPPNLPGIANDLTLALSERNDFKQYLGRVDHKLSDRDQLYGRFNYFGENLYIPGYFGTVAVGGGGVNVGDYQTHRPKQVELAETHIFRPNLLNDFRLAYNRHMWIFGGFNAGTDYDAKAGILGVTTDPNYVGFPLISITGYTSWGDGNYLPNLNREQSMFLMDHLNWVKGSHTIKAGFDLERYQFDFVNDPTPRGSFSFGVGYTGATSGSSGLAYAGFLLGYPSSAADTAGLQMTYFRQWLPDLYIQDDWKVSRRLTLNLGLRWEQQHPWAEKYGRMASFNFATGHEVFCNPSLVPAGFPYGNGASVDCSNVYAFDKDFSPRVGFAYRLTNDNKTVLRGAYGIFYDLESMNPILNLGANPPFSYQNSFSNNPVTPTTQFNTVFQATPVLGSDPSLNYIHQNWSPGYLQNWNLAVQRELMPGLSLDMAYVASKGTHLMWSTTDNNPLVPGPGTVQSRRPFPTFGSITGLGSGGLSSYNSLQIKVEKQMGHNLSFITAYTYSKSIDNSSNYTDTSFNPAWTGYSMRGRSAYDQTQRFVPSWLYALPVGRGQKLLPNAKGFTQGILGGWNVGGIYTYSTGFPFSIGMGPDEANEGTGGQRPNLVGNPIPSLQTRLMWYSPAAFALPTQYTFGNVGRDTVYGPHFSNIDFSVRKVFDITEKLHMEFRCELFNLLNNQNLGLPDATFTDASAGVISSGSGPRNIQFALRLYW